MADQAPIFLTVEGEAPRFTTLAAFIADNDFPLAQKRHLRGEIAEGRAVMGGGGAQPMWAIEPATCPVEFEAGPDRQFPAFIRGAHSGRVHDEDGYAYAADVTIYHFDGDLTALPYLELSGLRLMLAGRENRLLLQRRTCERTEAFAKRLWAEIPTREEYRRAFGPKASAHAVAA